MEILENKTGFATSFLIAVLQNINYVYKMLKLSKSGWEKY